MEECQITTLAITTTLTSVTHVKLLLPLPDN